MSKKFRYVWAITKDLLAKEGTKTGTNNNAVGMTGPSECRLSFDEICAHPARQEFRMLDDDGTPYYEGFYVPGENETGEDAFGPLDDFGQPNAGCTEIQYKEGGEWVTC